MRDQKSCSKSIHVDLTLRSCVVQFPRGCTKLDWKLLHSFRALYLLNLIEMSGNYTSLSYTLPSIHLIYTRRGSYFTPFGFLFPMSQPQPLSTLTTFGVTATVSGTLMNIKLLCIAYASASCVQMPIDPD